MSHDDADAAPRPPSRPRRTRDDAKRETREALINAGISAFSEEGLDTPSLDSICARAGYTRGAFYVHFKDRDDFVIEVMSTVLQAFIAAMIATGDAAFDLQMTIHAFVGAVRAGAFPIRHGVHFHQFMAACARSPRIRERYVDVLHEGARRVATAIREGQGANTVRSDIDADGIALLLVAIVIGVQGAIEVEFPVEAVVEKAARDLLKMLKPPATST